MGFVVDNHHWQAAIIERMIEGVVDDLELPEFDVPSAVRSIDDCLASGMPDSLPPDVRAELPLALRTLELPRNAVRSFLLHLCDHNVLQSDCFGTFTLPEDRTAVIEKAHAARQRRDRRLRSFETIIDAIVDGIPVEEHGDFILNTWRITPVPGIGLTLDELLMGDRSTWEMFEANLTAIRRMIDGGTWIRETMGLPLHGELLRAERRAAQQRHNQATEREDTLRRAVVATLGEDGSDWINVPDASGITPAQQARSGDAGLAGAVRAVDEHGASLAASAAADKRAERHRRQLRIEAEEGLGAKIAEMFLTHHDAVLRTSPWNASHDAAGFRRSQLELAKWIARERKRTRRR